MAKSEDIKLQAITIGFTNYREYDRVLTLFSPERGILTATAHAVRRPKSEIRACADMFYYGEFVLRKNEKGYLSVKSADMVEVFYDLRTDINRLSCATYMCDFVRATALQEEEQQEYFVMLLRCLSALCYDKADYKCVKIKFELSAMEILGYGASFEECAQCGRKIEGRAFLMDGTGGAVCRECNLERRGEDISPRALATLKQIQNMPVNSLSIIKMNDEVYTEINKRFKRYMYWHLERNIKSAAFLDKSYNYVK